MKMFQGLQHETENDLLVQGNFLILQVYSKPPKISVEEYSVNTEQAGFLQLILSVKWNCQGGKTFL